MSWTDEHLHEVLANVNEHGTQKKAAKALGITRSSLQRRLHEATKRGLDSSVPMRAAPGRKITGVSTLWVEGEKRSIWVKESLEPSIENIAEIAREVLEEYTGKSELIFPSTAATKSDLLSVYPIVDQHHGMLAWGLESGEDYDIKIGSKRLKDSFSFLVSQSPASEQALIINLGDFFHINDSKNMTPRSSNILDVDSRYPKIVKTGVQLMIDCIELALQKHQTVLVRNLPGNHDPDAVVVLNVALSLFYQNNPRVTIIDDPSEFFYLRHGTTLIGANHGHRLKPLDMALKLAHARPEDWGQSKFRWFMYGHFHSDQVSEVGGVRVERFQTLAAKDAHAANGGYLSGHSMNSITIHKVDGEVSRNRVNIIK